jgi:hypothetical protein
MDTDRDSGIQQPHKFFNRNPRVATNGAKGAGTELTVKRDCHVGKRLVALQHHVTAPLPAAPESAPLQCADAVLA